MQFRDLGDVYAAAYGDLSRAVTRFLDGGDQARLAEGLVESRRLIDRWIMENDPGLLDDPN